MTISRAAALARALQRAAETDLAQHIRWTPPQDEYLRCDDRYAVLTLGQQVGGKTTVGLYDLIARCVGHHPYQRLRHPAPIQAWLGVYSHQQGLQIQHKLWEMLPKHELAISTVYKGLGHGFRGKHPMVVFRNGSRIIIKTCEQGAKAWASGTVHFILFDEPPAPEVYAEAKGRLRRTNGVLRLTMTPVNQRCDHIRADVDAGIMRRIQHPLSVASVTPIGARSPLPCEDGTPMDADWIANLRAETPAYLAPVVLDGEWEERGEGRYYDRYIDNPDMPGSHVTSRLPAEDVQIRVGVDHGDRPGKQIAVLLATIVKDRHARVWVLDEYTDPTGCALPEDDARGILAMLQRNGLQWTDVDYVAGDRVHMPGTGSQKSNKDLSVAIAKELRVPANALRPFVRTAKRGRGRGAGSVAAGARWIYHAMVRPGSWHVHPRCAKVRASLNGWTGPGPDTPEKDAIDALRYALDDLIFGGVSAGNPQATVVVR